jgi:hypothetical protein
MTRLSPFSAMALAHLILSETAPPSPIILGRRKRSASSGAPSNKRAKVKAARKQGHRK